jgi:Mrp family chromosome partitioning ATPase
MEKSKGLLGGRNEAAPADTVTADNATLYIESIRNLRASIARAARSQATQVIGFTSAVPGEGKTETALSYARLLAVNTASVLLIDCDLRNGRLSSRLTSKPAIGLVEALQEDKLEGAVCPDQVAAGLDILPVSASFFTSQDLFGDGRMMALLEQARARYSAIVLDLPPVLGVADARTVALLADGVCFLVRWGDTRPEAAAQAVNLLASDGATLFGGAYTMVEPTSEVMAGGYYASTYHKYFKS